MIPPQTGHVEKKAGGGPVGGAACFPGHLGSLTAWGLRFLSPPPRTGGAAWGRLAAGVPSCTAVGAALGSGGLVPRGRAQAAGCVVVGPQGAGHLVLRCPGRAGAQAGRGHPRRLRQAEPRAELLAAAPHVQAAPGTGRAAA